jgi:DNA replication and repair protein RecF
MPRHAIIRQKQNSPSSSLFGRSTTRLFRALNKALQQRNALLKMETEPDASLMDLWEEEMASAGEEVFHKRSQFVEEMTPVFQQIYDTLSDHHETVSLHYVSHGQRGPLLDVIRRDRLRDRAVGYSLHGIHRDDSGDAP